METPNHAALIVARILALLLCRVRRGRWERSLRALARLRLSRPAFDINQSRSTKIVVDKL